MLHPDSTVLLTDALRPPPGYHVDHAVATTYSLTLTAMLIAPMTFTLGELGDSRMLGNTDPIQLLDAVERHVDHTTVFVQAGGIHVPTSHSRIHAFLEDSIHEVLPPEEQHLFHPKLWAVRYADDHGHTHHRILIASRNLTLDNSWDTVLVLDEDRHGTIPAAPAAEMLTTLPRLALEPLPRKRASAVDDLARTLHTVQLAAPAPFTGGHLLPLGLTDDQPWPLPANPARVLAISPFLSARTLGRIRGTSPQATLVSRAESMDRLGMNRLTGWETTTLHPVAEHGQDDAESVRALDEFTAVVDSPEAGPPAMAQLEGLHAKTVVLDLVGGESMTVTGSANLTEQAWSGGVEMDAVLTGPTPTCGVQAVLGEGAESLGLAQVLEPYTPADADGLSDPAIETSYQLEEFHRTLARHRPRLEITPVDKDTVSARLVLSVPDDPPGETRIWLTTVREQIRPLAGEHTWQIAPVNITPYLALETTAGEGAARVTRRCVLMMRLVGDPSDRKRAALAAILSSRQSVLRYLALLLGMDPVPGERETPLEDPTGLVVQEMVDGGASGASLPPLVLFEPLVRAAGQDPSSLAAVARQISELRQMPQAAEVIPAEFLQMWDVVLEAVQDRRAR
ncbi:hypothetical protein [Ruania albidiflava]|uniref:hypothetical protein n=1 Tax=Ruania albidiflava TaxID=366586 RepID=UPI0003B5552D|nr:hypothetical protein [Ruania albidiflava]